VTITNKPRAAVQGWLCLPDATPSMFAAKAYLVKTSL
jgi:hypothetical protein